jgi:uncharacterized membrane protein YdbT with pleckstrin-like domain
MEQTILSIHPAMIRNHPVAFILGCLLLLACGLGLLFFLWMYLKTISAKYTVTTERCICKYGLIAVRQNELFIEDIRGASLRQSVFQRILGVGDIAIASAATAGVEIVFKGIASPQSVIDQINQVRRGQKN